MPLQNFVANALPTIKAVWLNKIDAFYVTLFGEATTAAQARTAIDVPQTTGVGATGTWAVNLTGNVVGDVTGNLTGNVTGNVTGNLTGTASLATLATTATTATDTAAKTGTGSTYATSASPTFTGTPAAPTAASATNTTQLATTAFAYGTAVKADPLNCVLPNGIIIKAGSSTSDGAGAVAVTFATAFPTACVSATMQAFDGNDFVIIGAVGGLSAAGFTGQSRTAAGAQATVPFRWIAIGY